MYLLDTHTLLWYIKGSPKLSAHALDILENKQHTILVSKVSLWEIVVKLNIKKLTLPVSFERFVTDIESLDIQLLPISTQHLSQYLLLPLHHRDPFDRMLIAQSIHENIYLMGKDEVFDQYQGLKRVW